MYPATEVAPDAGREELDAKMKVSDDARDTSRWWVLLAVGVGSFMSALDGSVVNALLPTMRAALHTTVATIEWVVSIYLLVVSGLLLGFGRLGDLRGHRDVYLVGFAAFVATSALCGLAPSAPWLIAFRALQALAAATLFANSTAILARTFPPSERGRALGLQSVMTYLGLSAGPPLGGVLAAHLGWRAVFFINVPVGLAGLALARATIPRDARRARRRPSTSRAPRSSSSACSRCSSLSTRGTPGAGAPRSPSGCSSARSCRSARSSRSSGAAGIPCSI